MTSSTVRTFDVRVLLACAALWLALAGVSIFAHGPMPLYSTRTLSVAWEMWQLGEWLLPHQNGAAYSHKAPLLYWLYHAGWSLGGVNDVWPRLLALGFGAVTLVALARVARRLFPQRLAVAELAPWLFAGCMFVFLFALQLMFDVLLALCVLGAFLALLRGDIYRGQPHWPGFALAVALGLLTKGPVMLLHVAFPLLLAPWWSTAARERPRRWYLNAALAVLAASALFAAWLIPAALQGGPEYRQSLLWTQTAGRVVESFDHARAWWWYLAILPGLLLPWSLWPAAWRALARLRGDDAAGLRFLLVWLAPTLLAFSLISGKQPYYLVPQLAGCALLLAAALDRLFPEGSEANTRIALWPLGLLLLAGGLALWLAPLAIAHYDWRSHWPADLARSSTLWGAGIAASGALLLPSARTLRSAVARIAGASLVVAACVHGQFTRAYWHDYDLQPTASRLAQAQQAGQPIAHIGLYQGQFQFLGRLREPLHVMQPHEALAWARAHPDGMLIDYPREPHHGTSGRPLFLQPFRAKWIELWGADEWRLAHAESAEDRALPPGTRATEVHPPDYPRAAGDP